MENKLRFSKSGLIRNILLGVELIYHCLNLKLPNTKPTIYSFVVNKRVEFLTADFFSILYPSWCWASFSHRKWSFFVVVFQWNNPKF